MSQTYSSELVEFRYPDDWELQEETHEECQTITVSGTETAYWSITFAFDCLSPDEMMDVVIKTFLEEFGEIDVYEEVYEEESGAISRELQFVALELIVGVILKIYPLPDYTAMILYQGTDDELDEGEFVFDSISRSLVFQTTLM